MTLTHSSANKMSVNSRHSLTSGHVLNDPQNSGQYDTISLQPKPVVQCNIPNLGSTKFVNIVFESIGVDTNEADSNSITPVFRVSDENNKELCRMTDRTRIGRRGVEYLECRDASDVCVLLIGYPVGLGEVALLSPDEVLLGECQSNVEFVCLSFKVKYNFYDDSGKRLMKIIAIMPDQGGDSKFVLIVKRPTNEKLALIKMGTLKTCCHIEFKPDQTTPLERLQIIALWTGFMHNELKDTETLALAERQAAAELQRKESHRKKSFKQLISPPNCNPPLDDSPQSLDTQASSSTTTNNNRISPTANNNEDEITTENRKSGRFAKLSRTVSSHFSRHVPGSNSTNYDRVKNGLVSGLRKLHESQTRHENNNVPTAQINAN